MAWHPHVTVAALIERADRFLLVEEAVAGGIVYNQPAGHWEPGEDLLDAVRREVLEETRCRFEPQALVGIYQWTHPLRQETFLRFAFAGACGDPDERRALDAGIIACHWLTHAELTAPGIVLRSPLVLRGIDDYRAGRRYPLALLAMLSAAP